MTGRADKERWLVDVILAEFLAHFKHEIGSVIRPLATPTDGPPEGAVPAVRSAGFG